MSEKLIHVYLHEAGKVIVEMEGFTPEEEAEVRANKEFMAQMMDEYKRRGNFTLPLTVESKAKK